MSGNCWSGWSPQTVTLNGGAARAVITNDLTHSVNLFAAELKNESRWQIKDFHRSFIQITGSEKCQCRKARSQRNHLACCYYAWVSLKVQAKKVKQTMYGKAFLLIIYSMNMHAGIRQFCTNAKIKSHTPTEISGGDMTYTSLFLSLLNCKRYTQILRAAVNTGFNDDRTAAIGRAGLIRSRECIRTHFR